MNRRNFFSIFAIISTSRAVTARAIDVQAIAYDIRLGMAEPDASLRSRIINATLYSDVGARREADASTGDDLDALAMRCGMSRGVVWLGSPQ